MRRAEVRVDIFAVPDKAAIEQFFAKNGCHIISRDQLLKLFRPVARARRRGFYDEARELLLCQEPREVLQVPREYVRFIED